MSIWQRIMTAAAVAAVSLAGSSAAQAANVKINGSTLEYIGGQNAENDVTIEQGLDPYGPGTYTISELGLSLNEESDPLQLNSSNCRNRVDTVAPFGTIDSSGPNQDPEGPADTDGDLVADTAVCDAAGITLISADLSDGDILDDDEIALGFDTDVNTNSTIVTGPGADSVTGGFGNDDVDGGLDDDEIDGASGNDILKGNGGDDLTLLGGDGNDRLIGGLGDDQPDGEEGDDTYVADATADGSDLISDDGDDSDIDTVDYSARGTLVNVSVDDDFSFNDGDPSGFGEGDDVATDVERVFGGSAGDTLVGSSEDDILRGNLGNDTINGGGGNDTADYSNSGAVKVDLSKTTVQDTIGAGMDTLTQFSNVNGGSGGDTLSGSSVPNEISGGAGGDTINTRDSSSDTVDCGASTDSLVSDTSDSHTGCETVDDGAVEPPPAGGPAPDPDDPEPPPTAAGADRSAPSVSIASKSVKMSKSGAIKVKFGCPASESSCSGSVTLPGKAQVGSAIFSGIPGGGSKQVTIKLAAKVKKQVKKKKKLGVKLKIIARDASGNVSTTSVGITIKK